MKLDCRCQRSAAVQHQQRLVLPMDEEVRRHICQVTQALQRSASREQPSQEDVGGACFGERSDQGCLVAKVMTPIAKLAAVKCVLSESHISRSKACRIMCFSWSALYKLKVDWAAKDAPMIAELIDIVSKRSRWGFFRNAFIGCA